MFSSVRYIDAERDGKYRNFKTETKLSSFVPFLTIFKGYLLKQP